MADLPDRVPLARGGGPSPVRLWLRDWLMQGPIERAPAPTHHRAPWWQVMCLTGVDYFSTLGYQPGIAFLAAGFLSPVATFILVLLTLFGALPIYRRIAELSPHGEGSIALLEDLLPRWRGKTLVLCLLGFAATDFVITITLSAADATAHIIENPFVPEAINHPVGVTLLLLLGLCAIFLKGFREAIGLAVAIVAVYLALNLSVLVWGVQYIAFHPTLPGEWQAALWQQHGDPLMAVAIAALIFPRLALGLSGFETGVAVMPLVRGDDGEPDDRPAGRIRNTKRLLVTAAVIMSVMLMVSSFVSTLLIPPQAFEEGGPANGRALAYLAHEHLGETFGTLYDLSTIAILWFAGASAMAGLLNLVPRYMPRYGMAPDWAKATRPLVLVFGAITMIVTLIFQASVDAQAGAYATGVLVLMTSAGVAVSLSARRSRRAWLAFGVVTLVFIYTTIANIVERPEGIRIASIFIASIITVSLLSRTLRATELRAQGVVFDATADRFIAEAAATGVIRILANRPDRGEKVEYDAKLQQAADEHDLRDDAVLFVEVRLSDASEFAETLNVRGVEVAEHRVLRCASPAIPNALAALLLAIRDRTNLIPHAYFGWTEGSPVVYVLKFLALGEGDTAPVTREVLRQAEPYPARRPRIHLG
jgi:hypothetical protein